MKLINVIPNRSGGGAELLVSEIHERLKNLDIDSSVIYFTDGATDKKKSIFFLNSKPRNIKNIFLLRKKIKDIMQNENTIVHCHLTWGLLFTFIACINLNVKLVYTEHNTVNKKRSIPFFWCFERLIYKHIDLIICISKGTKISLEKWLRWNNKKNPIVTIYNGSRTYPRKKRDLDKEKFNFISIGSLTKKKNFYAAIKAIHEINHLTESYTIYGEGPERGKLLNLIDSLNLNEKIKLPGWNSDISQALDRSDIQIIPSLWEGFGLVAIEGLSSGIPIVASNVDGINEVISENNLPITMIEDPSDHRSIANAITKLLEKIKYSNMEAFEEAVDNLIDLYSLERMTSKYLEEYKKLLTPEER